ncbi:hypothetical protein AHIS2_p080 [Acaryochloris phage A-HIS2]|nr:hypothetical protein AHIS2_p080 [Acaryochloris phage A-HIS2]
MHFYQFYVNGQEDCSEDWRGTQVHSQTISDSDNPQAHIDAVGSIFSETWVHVFKDGEYLDSV